MTRGKPSSCARARLRIWFSCAAELLVDQALALLEVREAFLLAIGLKRLLRRLQLLLLLLDALPEPARGLARGGVAELERLLDIELGQDVGGVAGKLRIVGREAQVHEPAPRHRLHRDPGAECRDGWREGQPVVVDCDGGSPTQHPPLEALPGGEEGAGLKLRALLKL
jgi:hypothetical protein